MFSKRFTDTGSNGLRTNDPGTNNIWSNDIGSNNKRSKTQHRVKRQRVKMNKKCFMYYFKVRLG